MNADSKPPRPPPDGTRANADDSWRTGPGLLRRRINIIAAFSLTAVLVHVALRFGIRTNPATARLPLMATLVLGGSRCCTIFSAKC